MLVAERLDCSTSELRIGIVTSYRDKSSDGALLVNISQRFYRFPAHFSPGMAPCQRHERAYVVLRIHSVPEGFGSLHLYGGVRASHLRDVSYFASTSAVVVMDTGLGKGFCAFLREGNHGEHEEHGELHFLGNSLRGYALEPRGELTLQEKLRGF